MAGFPMNVVDVLHDRLAKLMPDHAVIDRPLRTSDPARSIGLYVADWNPEGNSQEIGQYEPTVSTYQFRVQNLVKHTDEIAGKALFALDAKSVRVVLYRDPNLRLLLSELVEELIGTRERATLWGVARQRFLSNEMRGTFVYLAQTDFWLKTESIEL